MRNRVRVPGAALPFPGPGWGWSGAAGARVMCQPSCSPAGQRTRAPEAVSSRLIGDAVPLRAGSEAGSGGTARFDLTVSKTPCVPQAGWHTGFCTWLNQTGG